MCGQKSQPTNVHRVERAEEAESETQRRTKFIRDRDSQRFDSFRRLIPCECEECANLWDVSEPDFEILWESLLKVFRDLIGVSCISGCGHRKCRAILHVPSFGQVERCGCGTGSLARISEEGFPYRRGGVEQSRAFSPAG